MSQYRPSLDNLLATVEQFLNDLTPTLSGDRKYKSQVSAFLLGVCRREFADKGTHDRADLATWNAILGSDSQSALEARRSLCEQIRSGGFDDRFDAILDTVLARTTDEVLIVRPDYIGTLP